MRVIRLASQVNVNVTTRFQLPRFRYKHCKYVGRFRGILHSRPLEY